MNGSRQSLHKICNIQKPSGQEKTTTSSSYRWPGRLNFCKYFCQYFDLERILNYNCFHYLFLTVNDCLSCMFSKACYELLTIFFPLPVKDCLCIYIMEINCCRPLLQWKKQLCKQFMEIPLYGMYFLESTSSIPSQQKKYSKITLESL